MISDIEAQPTFDDQFYHMRRLADDVCERTRVRTAVSPLKPAQLNSVTVDSDSVVTGRL